MPVPPSTHTLTLPSPTPVCDIAPGTIVGGKYRIVAPIGSGGMGAVYLAVDIGPLARPFALKLLANPTPVAHARFLDEARIMGTLHHPNIVSVTDFGTDPATGFDFYVMDEYLPTPDETDRLCRDILHCPPPAPRPPPAPLSLARLLDNHKTLPEAAVRSVALELLSAIEAAHALSPPVIHRDIKPSNILFSSDGRALLADFGIAKRLAPDETSPTLPGATPGTPAYAAPEQLAGAPVGPAADYYSFGVVLYRALTGGMPFPSPALPADIAPTVSPAWADLFPALLEKDPAKRLSIPARIRALLEQPASPPRPRRRPAYFVLPALALALLLALFLHARSRPSPAPDPSVPSSAPVAPAPSPSFPDGQPSVGHPTSPPAAPPLPPTTAPAAPPASVPTAIQRERQAAAFSDKATIRQYVAARRPLLDLAIDATPDDRNIIVVPEGRILLSGDISRVGPPPTVLLDGGTLLFAPFAAHLWQILFDQTDYYLENAPDNAPPPSFLPIRHNEDFPFPILVGPSGGRIELIDDDSSISVTGPVRPADGLPSATLHIPPDASPLDFTSLDPRIRLLP